MELTAEGLARACGDLAQEAGITIEVDLEPLAGPGAPVKPAVYEGGQYQLDRRWWGEGDAQRAVDVVVIDNEPSQANRLEATLELLRAQLGLPEIVLDLSPVGALPPHLPERLSAFRFPHRNADAYLRDALLDGVAFSQTKTGGAIFGATSDRPLALFEWFPQALLYGFWQSHLGKKRSQAKLARSWTSSVVGYDPATTDIRVLGLKGDSLNLSVDEAVEYDEDDLLSSEWTVAEGSTKSTAKGKKRDRLSNLGHGQVLADAAPAGVSFAAITQRSTVSFAALRRISTGLPETNAPARALLVSLGLVAQVVAFGRSFSLRSGCELRPRQVRWTWLGADRDEPLTIPTQAEAINLFEGCVANAAAAGLPVGASWATDPLLLQPNDSLVKAIRGTWPLEG